MADAYISLIPRNLVRLQRTDSNGKPYKSDNSNNIGHCAMAKQLENINSENLAECCDQNEWVACNTHFIPTSREIQNLATWHSHDGQQAKTKSLCTNT